MKYLVTFLSPKRDGRIVEAETPFAAAEQAIKRECPMVDPLSLATYPGPGTATILKSAHASIHVEVRPL